ncbi:abnormal long morphology protein 1-like isoform X2 [Nasonia vitripennis]|uniref:Uncharacterized protein n=1 Tax=Nasonia vitripennis TaxID=7425 RepID=A0A7M7QTQ3_NASVI|nr:abnormal long morphology protein 1-like isoform X2 [Nasonia vitripennis]XP_032454559.1 abnormal long morphology protein 1-like isoform X2 [Nasonia vitripennis]
MARHCTSKMFQKNNILVLEDSEHSFLILGKDLMESIRGSSPDEGVSDCDYRDEQSAVSSVSNCNCNTATDNKVDLLLKAEQKNVEGSENNTVMQEHEYEKKITTFQDEVALALRETSKNRRMLRSVGGSIDEIDSALDYMEQSVHSTIYLTSAEMSRSSATVETQAAISSMEKASVSASIESLIQDAMNETEEQWRGTSWDQTEFSAADSRKLQDHLQKRNTSDVDPRDLEIMHLKLMNKALREQNERLKNKVRGCSIELENSKLKEEMVNLNQQLESLGNIEDVFSEIMTQLETYEKIIDVLRDENLTKDFRAIKIENDALLMEKNKWSEERGSLHESNKLLKYELKLTEEKCEILKQEIDLLRTKSGTIQVDLDNTKAELAEARRTISELQAQNSDLQETEISADVYNSRIEKQEIDILRLRATEKSYLCQIELLTDENKILRDYINHTFLN